MIFLVFGCFTNCDHKENRNSSFVKNNILDTPERDKVKYVEKFDDFFTRFFNDSIFQKTRIDFPLRGMSTEYIFDERESIDTVGDFFVIRDGKFYWTKDNWVFLQNANLNQQDYSYSKTKGESYYEITYRSKVDDIVLFFKFQSESGLWYLTYYSFEWN